MISLKGKGHFGGKTSHNTHQDSTSAPALWWRGNPTLRDPDFLSSYSRSPQSSSSLSLPARCLEDPTHFSLHPNWNALISADQEQPTPNQTCRLRHQGNALLRLMRILQAALMDTGSITLARPSCSTGRAMWRAEELGSLCFWLDINSLRKPSSWRSFLFEQWPCCTSRPRKQALPNSSPSLLMCCTWSGQPCFFILGLVLFRM